jgi:hypothetical protein
MLIDSLRSCLSYIWRVSRSCVVFGEYLVQECQQGGASIPVNLKGRYIIKILCIESLEAA